MNAKKIFLILGLAASLVTTPTLNAGFMPKMIEENPRMTAAITSGTAALLAGSMILAPKTRAKIQRALNRMIKRGGPAASASDIALATATIMAAIGAAGLGGYSVMGRKKAAPAQEQANPLDDIQRAGVASTVTTPESDNPAEAPEIAAKKAHAAREIQRRFRGYKERIAAERAESARIAAEEARKKLITDAFRLNQKKATPPHDSATPSPTEWVELTATEFQALALLTKQLDATEGVGANRIASMLKRNKITKAESTDHVLIEKVSFDTLKQMIQKNTARIAAEEAEATRIAAEEAQAAREIQRIVRGKIGRRTAEEAHAARIAAEEAHAARIAAEEAEATRIAAQEAEAARIAAQEAEAARIAAQEAEAARIAAEEADPARAAKEAEAGRIAAEEAEAARVAAEEAEAARVAAEEAEATRKADAAFNYTTPDSYALSGSKSNTH